MYKNRTCKHRIKTKNNILVVVNNVLARYLLSIQLINRINILMTMVTLTADLVILGFSFFDFQYYNL